MILLKLIQAVGDGPRGRKFTQTNSIGYQAAAGFIKPTLRAFISPIVLLSVHKKRSDPPAAGQNNETNYLSYLSFLRIFFCGVFLLYLLRGVFSPFLL